MAKSVEQIILELEIREGNLNERIVRLNKTIDNAKKGSQDYERALKKLQLAEIQLAETSAKLTNAQKSVGVAHQQNIKNLDQTKNATGATTSSVLELGRVISDAPYGIRGMANNLTQLVSQLAFATKTAGSFGAALRGMWTAMMGPLGVVVAITAVISAFDYFFGAQTKAKESADETTDALSKQREELEKLTERYEDYIRVQEKVTMSISKDMEMLKALTKETLDLTNSEERRQTALNKLIELYPKYFDGKNIDNIKGIFEAEKQTLRVLQNKEKLKNALNKAEKISNEIQLELIRIRQQQEKGVQPDTRRIGELREEQKQVRELIGVYSALDLTLKDEKSKARGKAKKRPIADILEDLYGVDISPEAVKKYQEELLSLFELNTSNYGIDFAPELDFTFSPETQANLDAYNEMVKDHLSKKLNSRWSADLADSFKEGLNLISDFVDARFERDLVTEQNKTTALNDELNKRLLNEQLSADERQKIQQQIWQNDEALNKKQNEIKKKRFNANKAFQLAMAGADTASAALKAYGSQLVVGDPTSLVRAKVAAAIATATGLAQIATIASQKFQPDAATTPIRTGSAGGAGGGVGDRSFDFNLVGNNQNNQLVNAIQSQFDKPLKAFVVSKDITNQQQLDANIKGSARFGD